MTKRDAIVCSLRIKLRAMLSWRADLIRAPSHPPEGLMLLLFIFFPKATSAVLPVVSNTSSTNPAENHLPLLRPGDKPCQTQPKGVRGRTHLLCDTCITRLHSGPLSCNFHPTLSIGGKEICIADQQPKVGCLCSCKTEDLLSRLLAVQSHR